MTAIATADHQQERVHLTELEYQRLSLRCLSLLAEGNSIPEIAEAEGISFWRAKQVLSRINQEARDGLLSNMIAERIPITIEISLEELRILTKKLTHIMNTSKDERCVMQSCAQLASLVKLRAEILESSSQVAKAVRHVLVLHPPKKDGQQEEEGDQSTEEVVEKNSN